MAVSQCGSMLSSALIGCFTAQLISVARTANRSLLSGVNDGEIGHPTLYLFEPVSDEDTDFERFCKNV